MTICQPWSSPLDRAEAESPEHIEDDGDEELPVKREHRRVPEGQRRRKGLHELEDGKGRGRVFLECPAEQGKYLEEKILGGL